MPPLASDGERSHLGFVCVLLVALSLCAAALAVKSQHDVTRKALRASEDALILNLQRRRYSLAGTLAFSRTVDGQRITCRTQAVIGEVGDDLHVGDTIAIIPRDDSCGEPVIVGPRHSERFAFGAALALLMAGFCVRNHSRPRHTRPDDRSVQSD